MSQWRRRSLERDVRGEEKSRNADRLSTKSDSSQPPLIESDGRSLRNSVQEGGETVWGRSLAWLDRELQVPLGCPVAAWQTPYMRKYCNASCHHVSVLTGMLGISSLPAHCPQMYCSQCMRRQERCKCTKRGLPLFPWIVASVFLTSLSLV